MVSHERPNPVCNKGRQHMEQQRVQKPQLPAALKGALKVAQQNKHCHYGWLTWVCGKKGWVSFLMNVRLSWKYHGMMRQDFGCGGIAIPGLSLKKNFPSGVCTVYYNNWAIWYHFLLRSGEGMDVFWLLSFHHTKEDKSTVLSFLVHPSIWKQHSSYCNICLFSTSGSSSTKHDLAATFWFSIRHDTAQW